MVATSFRPSSSDLSRFHKYCSNTETLNQWISTVRYKKVIVRRQRRNQDLRVAAVLTSALKRAEADLKRRQSERAQRWAQIRFEKENGANSKVRESSGYFMDDDETTVTTSAARGAGASEEDVEKLWNCELNGLHNLFNDLSQIKTAVVR